MNNQYVLADEAATVALGAIIGQNIAEKLVIFLIGNLGMGKTTLTRGILQGMGHVGSVKSPTYTLVEPYQISDKTVFHFDLYRLHDPEELDYMGFRDYLAEGNLCLIEWPERGEGWLPQADVTVQITTHEQGRCVSIASHSDAGYQLLAKINQ